MMAQDSENIEAKLAAYIDGELDDAGRADIEAHLAANSRHRALLEELAKTHALLAGLPRESAPAEIAEEFNGQLERSVLLKAMPTDEAIQTHRLNRRPQLLSLAAIMALTVGLGVVVYYVLLPTERPPTFTVAVDKPRTRPTEPMAAPMEAGKPEGRDEHLGRVGGGAGGIGGLRDALKDAEAKEVGDIDADLGVIERRLADVPVTQGPTALVLVVRTDDVRATQDQILQFLSVNGIEFQPLDETPKAMAATVEPTTRSQGQAGEAGLYPQYAARSRDESLRPSQGTPSDRDVILARGLTVPQADALARALPRWRENQSVRVYRFADSDADSTADRSDNAANGPTEEAPVAEATRRTPRRLIATTRPVDALVGPLAKAAVPAPVAAWDETTASQGPVASAVDATPAPAAPSPGARVGATPPADDRSVADSATQPTLPPAPKADRSALPIESGEWLRITLASTDDPTAKVLLVRVAGDGTIELPTVGVFSAFGRTPGELAEQLAAAYRSAGVVLARAVAVERVATPEGETAGRLADERRVDLMIYVAGDGAAPRRDDETGATNGAAPPAESPAPTNRAAPRHDDETGATKGAAPPAESTPPTNGAVPRHDGGTGAIGDAAPNAESPARPVESTPVHPATPPSTAPTIAPSDSPPKP